MFLNFRQEEHCLSTFRNDRLGLPEPLGMFRNFDSGFYEIFYTPESQAGKAKLRSFTIATSYYDSDKNFQYVFELKF